MLRIDEETLPEYFGVLHTKIFLKKLSVGFIEKSMLLILNFMLSNL